MTVDYRIRNILIAAALAAAAVLLTVIYVTSARSDDQAAKQSVTVYTAAKSYGAGTAGTSIAGGMQKTTVTKSALVKDAVTSPTQINGLYLVQPVVAGEQLTLQRFALPSEQGVRAKLVGKQRAVQIAGDANQVLKGTLVPGDRVDVVTNLKSTEGLGQPEMGTVLRNIRVLETGDADGTSVDNPSDSVSAVVLGVTDAQAQQLYFATRNGEWSLVLRPVKKPKDSAPTGRHLRHGARRGTLTWPRASPVAADIVQVVATGSFDGQGDLQSALDAPGSSVDVVVWTPDGAATCSRTSPPAACRPS